MQLTRLIIFTKKIIKLENILLNNACYLKKKNELYKIIALLILKKYL